MQFCRGSLQALCGSVPGYTGVKQAIFKEGLGSVPDPGAKMADGAALQSGSDFESWRDWRRVLLRSPSELHEAIALVGRVAPHTDPELVRKPRCYARLVRVSFGPPSEATAGVFVVPKKLGKQRLIFDTRRETNIFGGHGLVRCLLRRLGLDSQSTPPITWRRLM